MPCSSCGESRIIYDNRIYCPKCDHLAVLDHNLAIEVCTKLRDLFNKVFFEDLGTYDKQILLGNLAAHREEFSRRFFYRYSSLDLGILIAYTILLKKSVEYGIPFGRFPDGKDDVSKLVNNYVNLLEIESSLLNIKSGRERILYLEKFDKNNLTTDQLLNNFIFVDDEKMDLVRIIYAKHDLYSSSEGEKKIQDYEGKIFSDVIGERSYTKEQFVSTFYDLINTFYVGLLRNRLYADNFDLRSFAKLMDDPADLMRFVNTFRYLGQDSDGKEIQTICKTASFLNRASKFFDVKKKDVMKMLVFDADNPYIFPLFIRFKNDTLGDVVVISHRFSYFVYTMLHAIITKDLLDLETEKRSKEFEQVRVKCEFEKMGYTYIPPKKISGQSSLEIDGVAYNDKICYVIECKSWRLPKLFDEINKQDQISRDIQGIIKGEKYTHQDANGSLKVKKIVSIKDKVEFVKQNRARIGLGNIHLDMIKGLVVIEDYPPISEFDGICIISIEEVKEI